MNVFVRIKKALYVLFVRDNRVNHELSKWEIEKGQLLSRIKKLENQLLDKRMETMEKLLSVRNSENMESEMLKMFATIFLNKSSNQSTPSPQNISPSAEVILTEQQIRDMINSNPKIKATGQLLDDDTLRVKIMNYIPNISKDTLEKTIEVIRE